MQHQWQVPTIPISSRHHGLESFCETYPISASKVISHENGFFTSKVISHEIGLVEDGGVSTNVFLYDRLSLVLWFLVVTQLILTSVRRSFWRLLRAFYIDSIGWKLHFSGRLCGCVWEDGIKNLLSTSLEFSFIWSSMLCFTNYASFSVFCLSHREAADPECLTTQWGDCLILFWGMLQ